MVSTLLALVPTYGQNQKREVTVTDFSKWSSLMQETISPKGEWATYVLHYDYGPDTLFVQNIKSTKRIAFPECNNARFSNDDKWLTVSDPQKGLTLYNLKTDNKHYFKDAIQNEFCEKENYIAILNKNAKSKYLTIIQLATSNSYLFEDVTEFSLSTSGLLAINTNQEVELINPRQQFEKRTIARDNSAGFKKLFWSPSGQLLAFFQEIKEQSKLGKNYRIFYHDVLTSENSILDSRQEEKLSQENISTYGGSPALRFSDDEKSLFFNYLTLDQNVQSSPYEIWDSSTPLEYNQNKNFGNPYHLPKLAIWTPGNGKIIKISTIEHPKTKLSANRKYALCYNDWKYEPQYEYFAPADMYVKNIDTGLAHLILEKQSTTTGMIGCSPKGNFIHYYKNGNWWVYDIPTMQHRNLTANLPTSIISTADNYPDPSYPYTSPVWTSDEKYFIVYDQYDIWLISSDGKQSRKITNGRELKIRYRICLNLYPKVRKPSTDEFIIPKVDLSQGLIIKANKDDGSSGFYMWTANASLSKLTFDKVDNSSLQKAEKADQFIYLEQTDSNPPKLMTMQKNKKPLLLFQSNLHANMFQWGQAELIHYKDKNGHDLKGILYKPAGFKKGKKYPMVVYIYEKKSQEIFNYHIPTEYDVIGFNPSNYFTDGYLVLLPDIQFKIGEPGRSAVDCVLKAVEVVKEMKIVEENHIGIIGHSYGGYETAFIITQTNAFAAAVCGSGLMNTISSYFYPADKIRSNAWRFESQQGRMQFSPFEDWKAYERDAPLPNAANCTTPLFSWAGKNDVTISWMQSAEFHIALRRLKKKNIFILYENEPHTITTPELQKDLTIKTKNWFDYYLKEKKDCLINGIP